MEEVINTVHENIIPKKCLKPTHGQPVVTESEAETLHENSNLKKMKSNAANFASIIVQNLEFKCFFFCFFFIIDPLKEDIFLTTFYGLYKSFWRRARFEPT